MTTLNVIASCADRKRGTVPAALCLREHRGPDLETQFSSWWTALESVEAERLPAVDLYAGPYWTAVKGASVVGKIAVRRWVASAGYGLVPFEAKLKPYAATFASRTDDSVTPPGEDPTEWSQGWWESLGKARPKGSRSPRTLSALVAEDPTANLLVLGSPSYLRAIEPDLAAAATSLRGELLVVGGSPGPTSTSLRAHWLPSTASLLPHVGGALHALHGRVGAKIVDEFANGVTLAEARSTWAERAAEPAKPLAPVRDAATDDEVRAFIRRSLDAGASPRHTPLLRAYRSAGWACEQSRFRELFNSVISERS